MFKGAIFYYTKRFVDSVYILDQFPGAYAAYGVEKLSSSYSSSYYQLNGSNEVLTWYDQSGNSRDATGVTGSAPVYQSSTNDLDFVFNKYLLSPMTMTDLCTPPLTVIAKVTSVYADEYGGIFFARNSSPYGNAGFHYKSGNTIGHHWNDQYFSTSSTGSFVLGSTNTLCWRVTSTALTYFINGASSGVNTGSYPTLTNTANFYIGADVPLARYMQGRMSCLLVYKSSLSDTDVATISSLM